MATLWSGRSVLVTGGTGFIGSFLVEELLDRGANVRVPLRAENYRALSSRRSEIEWLEGDLRDAEYCADLVRGVDEVFHLAGSRRNTEYHKKRPSDVINDNARMTLALLDGLRECEMAVPVTFFSSANVPPVIDIVALSQAPKVDGYVIGKAMAESFWFAASRQRKFPLMIIRPVGSYGPRDTFNEDANLIPALMVQTRDEDEKLIVRGDGTQERAFLYIKDLISAVLLLREKEAQGIQYITSNDVITVSDLATKIRDLVNPGLPIEFQASKNIDERTIPMLPMHPALKSMKWTSLDEGLRSTYESWTGQSLTPAREELAIA